MSHSGLQVLIIEDHAETARMLAELISMEGHAVRTALDGPSALAQAKLAPPDVAVIDLGLPGMDGYAVAHALCNVHRDRRPLFVMVTGQQDVGLHDRSLREGIDLHLVKPIEPEAIHCLLRRFSEILSPPEAEVY